MSEPRSQPPPEDKAPGGIPERFELLALLGRGAFGSVYSVQDTQSGELLALKQLDRSDPSSMDHFKREFQILKDAPHPRLAPLGDLYFHNGTWSFTMKLIVGAPFHEWVLGQSLQRQENDDTNATQDDTWEEKTTSGEEHAPGLTLNSSGEAQRPFSEVRLRAALRQLAEGVLALHERGILHCNLKPRNALIDENGQLFLLDFGLAPQNSGSRGPGNAQMTRGTPAYLSPEQARGAAPQMASDWYAVGVMLYETLTGQLPFIGSPTDMVTARLNRAPHDPGTLIDDLPSDLTSLCMALLERDPFARPNGHRISHLLGLTPSVAATPRALEGGLFVGRKKELQELRTAFHLSLSGRCVISTISGRPGIGKTALVQRFTTSLAINGEATVLHGKSFERDVGPFQAVSDLVDDLIRHLAGLPEVEAARLMPRDILALTKLFPRLASLLFGSSKTSVVAQLPQIPKSSGGAPLQRSESFSIEWLTFTLWCSSWTMRIGEIKTVLTCSVPSSPPLLHRRFFSSPRR